MPTLYVAILSARLYILMFIDQFIKTMMNQTVFVIFRTIEIAFGV